MLCAIGIVGAIPFYVALFFLPLHGLDVPEESWSGTVAWAVLSSVFINGWVAAAFALALRALALTSLDSPNWFALISEVHLPEHRGTAFGLANLSNGISRSFGMWLTPAAPAFFAARFAQPWNFFVGLGFFQLFFLPTGLCYYEANGCEPSYDADQRRSRAEDCDMKNEEASIVGGTGPGILRVLPSPLTVRQSQPGRPGVSFPRPPAPRRKTAHRPIRYCD